MEVGMEGGAWPQCVVVEIESLREEELLTLQEATQEAQQCT
jgi:hypothetical protein